MAAMRALTSLLLLLAACAPPPAAPQPASSAIDIHVYFTDPLSEASQTLRGGPDAQLAAAIDRARLSVDMAMYDLNLWSVRDALIAAHQRGVTVRLVVEGDNLAERSELQELLSAGIPVVGDTSRNFMHNKFTVIDGFQVWTGSVNLTISDMYYNRNNLLELQSVDLARNYTTEFQEMFTNGLFGEESPANTPQTEIELGDLRIETYFSPDDGTLARILELVDAAETSVYVLAFSLTSDALADALLAAASRGVAVTVLMDEDQALNNIGGEYQRLLGQIPLALDVERGNLHHKVIIVDSHVVVTGSYNFSANAEFRNDENTLVIHSAEIAQTFLQQFELLWSLAN
jgi:phosphatidylserine/phosphatidylglycerophosphate/cardiolipin synthase-like enzyme